MTAEQLNKQLNELWLKREAVIEKMALRFEKEIFESQRALLEMLFQDVAGNLTVQDGLVAGTNRNLQILLKLESNLNKFQKQYVDSAVRGWAASMLDVTEMTREYYAKTGVAKLTTENLASVKGYLQKGLGIVVNEKTTRIIPGGYLDTLSTNDPLKQELKGYVTRAIFGGMDYRNFVGGMKTIITGSEDVDGKLLRYWKGYSYDTHNMALSASDLYVANQLQLNHFIYEGSVIETSRDFCRKRSGKVFTRKEAKKWDGQDWVGKNRGSTFYISRGGYGCRHWINWITDDMAKEFER